MTWDLHPDALDPQLLLHRLDQIRQDLSDHPDHAPALRDEHLDEIQDVLTAHLNAPRAKYQGRHVDRPPPVVFMAPHPQTSIFQSVVQDCLGPVVGADGPDSRRPLWHWAEEVKDIYRRFGPCDPRWLEVRLYELLTHDTHPFVKPADEPVGIGDTAEVVLVGDWPTALPQALNVSQAIRARLQGTPTIERHVIHLGDTYYCGLREEYEHRFLPHWPVDAGSPV
ncbi:MAG TPA: hypothetical protein VEJ84_05245, partial [Acidimicrobiales bacterium]|nr:hypothetical protein [Acidimicrobiales bacterium]